jgi:hypothetical protein
MGRGTGYIAGYIVKVQDLDLFMETNQIQQSRSIIVKIIQINKWIDAHKTRPQIPILTCIKVDGERVGLVLTNHFHRLPEDYNPEGAEWDQGFKGRFAAAGNLEEQSSTWKFIMVPNA